MTDTFLYGTVANVFITEHNLVFKHFRSASVDGACVLGAIHCLVKLRRRRLPNAVKGIGLVGFGDEGFCMSYHILFYSN